MILIAQKLTVEFPATKLNMQEKSLRHSPAVRPLRTNRSN